MKNIYKLLIIISLISLIYSCSDCPLTEQPPVILCETRIVTLEKFNPNFTVTPGTNPGEEIVTLAPDYNISIYEFPLNSGSTGSFPNDNRFKDNIQLPVASMPFAIDNVVYYANFMDTYPTNADLAADILVSEVNVTTNPVEAFFRIFGSIEQIDQNYFSENAQEFCDYVKNNRTIINNSFASYTDGNKYGANQPGAVIKNYDTNPVIVTDQSGKIIGTVGQKDVPVPPSDIIAQLKVLAQKKSAVELRVIPGNIYTYIAKNGKRFVFLITEIRQTNITPFRKRVTIMLYPLDK